LFILSLETTKFWKLFPFQIFVEKITPNVEGCAAERGVDECGDFVVIL
jgi:hypothetical protein